MNHKSIQNNKMIQVNKMYLTTTAISIGMLMLLLCTNCELSTTNASGGLNEEAKAQQDAMFARQDLVQAQRDSIANEQEFRTRAEARILENHQAIADFKVRILTGEKALKYRYQKRLTAFEQQNNDLRVRLSHYAGTPAKHRKSFQHTWNYDMQTLAGSLNEMTQINQ